MILLDILIPLAAVLLDQLVKLWALRSLQPVGTIPLIPNVFHLTYCENTGAAFSILSGRRWLLLLITFVMLVGMVYALRRGYLRNRFGRVAILLIIGGAVGNVIDRMFRGFVVDMFDFRLINFAIFNVADVLLNVGVFMVVIYVLFMEPRLNKKEKNSGDSVSDSGRKL